MYTTNRLTSTGRMKLISRDDSVVRICIDLSLPFLRWLKGRSWTKHVSGHFFSNHVTHITRHVFFFCLTVTRHVRLHIIDKNCHQNPFWTGCISPFTYRSTLYVGLSILSNHRYCYCSAAGFVGSQLVRNPTPETAC